MSRITKAIAEEIADILTEKHVKEISTLENNLRVKAEEIFKNTIPGIVLEVYKKFPNYFKQTTKNANFKGQGISNYKNISFNNYYPYNDKTIQLNEYQADQIVKMSDEIEDKKSFKIELHSQIQNTLIALRTYNNVEKEFPEAFDLLPKKSINTSLIVDIKNVRCKLNPNNCN